MVIETTGNANRYPSVPSVSVSPVLDLQARHRAEVLEVASHQRGPVGQGDCSDQQISPAHLPQLLVLAPTVELGCRRGIDREDAKRSKGVFRLIEPLLSTLQFQPIGSLQ